MKKLFLICILSLPLGLLAQFKKAILKNGVEVEYQKEKKSALELTVLLNRSHYFENQSNDVLLNQILKEYSKDISNAKTTYDIDVDKIQVTSTDIVSTTITNLVKMLKNFSIPNEPKYQKMIEEYANANGLEFGSQKTLENLVGFKYYEPLMHPLLKRKLQNIRPTLLSNSFKNDIGLNTIKIQAKGNFDKSMLLDQLELQMRLQELGNVDLASCPASPTLPKPIKAYQALETNDGIHLVFIQKLDKKLSKAAIDSLTTSLGENVKVHSFTDYSEIRIDQSIDAKGSKTTIKKGNEDGSVDIILSNFTSGKKLEYTFTELKKILSPMKIDLDQFNLFVTGDPKAIHPYFDDTITYYNIIGEEVSDPSIYRMVKDKTAKQIIDNYYAKVGEQVKVEDITNMRSDYKIIYNKKDLEIGAEIFAELPYKKSKKIFYKNREISNNVFDGTNGFFNINGDIRNYNEDETKDALLEQSFFPERFYDPTKMTVIGIVKEEDTKQYYKIKAQVGEYTAYIYFNAGNDLIYRKEYYDKEKHFVRSVDYINYTRLAGLLVPHTMLNKDAGSEVRMEIRNMTINQPVNESEFTLNTDAIVAQRIGEALKMQSLMAIDEKFLLIEKIVDTEDDAIKRRNQLVLGGYFQAKYKNIAGKYYVIYQGYETEKEIQKAFDKIYQQNTDVMIIPADQQ